ncbi:MAG: hypothetical protein JHC30_03985 [Caldisericum sp.]|jgi:hypothetical protein|nr:hypothetical protein [Caldisericum sp.]
MCIIAVSLSGERFTEEELKKMWDSNPHGAGVAWLQGKRVKVIKGIMSYEGLVAVYEKIPEGAVHALHCRLRSAGEILPQLTHPFRVDKLDTLRLKYTAEAVLFHNGTVSDWRSMFIAVLSAFTQRQREQILSLKNLSDTYVASLLVNRFGIGILKHIEAFSSKWLIFKAEPVFIGSWDEDKKRGMKFSNMSWKYGIVYSNVGSRYTYTYRGLASSWRGNSCDVCGIGNVKKDDDDDYEY